MGYEQYKAKAPGSFMLFGEHAVLRGKFAIACAANQWIYVTLTPEEHNYIHIVSPSLGEYKTDIANLRIEPPFQFVLGALSLFKHTLRQGATFTIESEFSHQIGLGSSAAVTVAAIAVIAEWQRIELSKQELFQKARQVIRNVQGQGSGTDIAASIYGGVIAYQSDPVHIEKLPIIEPLHLIYCGYKTPTPEVINLINHQYNSQPEFYDHLFACIGLCTLQAIEYIKTEQWRELGNVMKVHHSLQKALGSSDEVIDEIIYQLSLEENILGAKISGSGLGDCVVALGNLAANTFPNSKSSEERNVTQISIEVAREGLSIVH